MPIYTITFEKMVVQDGTVDKEKETYEASKIGHAVESGTPWIVLFGIIPHHEEINIRLL